MTGVVLLGQTLGKFVFKYINRIREITLISRMIVKWEDKRFIEENRARETECKSNQVEWKKKDQFWIPNFHVDNALRLVL